MKNRVALIFVAVTLAALAPLSAQVPPTPNPSALTWNAESLEYNPKPGEESAPFTFYVTNTTAEVISITSLRTSCGCTVAQLPPLPAEPFKLGAGSNVAIGVSMNLAGKAGTVTKSINVDTTAGNKSLLVKVNMPATPPPAAAGQPTMDNRAKNVASALADRQAVFKGDCASCHVEKGKGKLGADLYAASCGICHDSAQRAAMVPDLHAARTSRDLAFWQKWIMEGKPGTMMPAFAALHGGPLTQEQIDSLTVYLYQNYPNAPQATAAIAPSTSVPSTIVLPTPVKN